MMNSLMTVNHHLRTLLVILRLNLPLDGTGHVTDPDHGVRELQEKIEADHGVDLEHENDLDHARSEKRGEHLQVGVVVVLEHVVKHFASSTVQSCILQAVLIALYIYFDHA
jgi:hypothetical protein